MTPLQRWRHKAGRWRCQERVRAGWSQRERSQEQRVTASQPGHRCGCWADATQLRQWQPLLKSSSPEKEGSPSFWPLISDGADLRFVLLSTVTHATEPLNSSHWDPHEGACTQGADRTWDPTQIFHKHFEGFASLTGAAGLHFCHLMSLEEALQLQLIFFYFEGKGGGMVKMTLFLYLWMWKPHLVRKNEKNLVSYFPVYTSQVMAYLKKYWHFQAEVKVLQYYMIQWQILVYLPSQVIPFHEKCKFTFKNDWQKYFFSSTLLLTTCLHFQ